MKLTNKDIQLALKLSKTIQHFLEITGNTNLRSTDVFPYLKRHGYFKNDVDNGKEFRSFLKKLYKANMLGSLVPQCHYIPSLNNPNFGEWYFHDAKDKMPKANGIKSNGHEKNFENNLSQIKSTYAKMDINEAIDIVQMLIAGINPVTERLQDDLGVCADPTVIEALKTIIDPEAYREEIDALTKTSEIKKPKSSAPKENKTEYLSATALGKLKDKTYSEVISVMTKYQYIADKEQITYLGFEKGLMFRQNPNGNKWIVYPESLKELLD
ncbi:hypothetical protein [Tamlana flava]|uniref:hypothetical protein n=1 Tax=Tamlana flava TaxID=3158572 RepID=UPI00351ABDA5